MDEPTETLPVTLQPGQVVDVPADRAASTTRSAAFQARRFGMPTVAVIASPSGEQTTHSDAHPGAGEKRMDGDVLSLRYFVTPDDSRCHQAYKDVHCPRRVIR